jgi:hypothetical protein
MLFCSHGIQQSTLNILTIITITTKPKAKRSEAWDRTTIDSNDLSHALQSLGIELGSLLLK